MKLDCNGLSVLGAWAAFASITSAQYMGYNVATGQTSFPVDDANWIEWLSTLSSMDAPPLIKYYWRDHHQLDLQLQKWGNKTDCVLAIQNEELPLNRDDADRVLSAFAVESAAIIRGFVIGNEADAFMTPQQFASTVIDSMRTFAAATAQHQPGLVVSTPITMRMFSWEDMSITPDWEDVFVELMKFLEEVHAPLMVNIYPYLSYLNRVMESKYLFLEEIMA